MAGGRNEPLGTTGKAPADITNSSDTAAQHRLQHWSRSTTTSVTADRWSSDLPATRATRREEAESSADASALCNRDLTLCSTQGTEGEQEEGDAAFFFPTSLPHASPCQSLRVAFPGESVTLQARAHRNVADGVAAAAALDGYSGGFGSHGGCRNYDPRDLHKVGHLVRLKGKR